MSNEFLPPRPSPPKLVRMTLMIDVTTAAWLTRLAKAKKRSRSDTARELFRQLRERGADGRTP